MKQDNEEQKGHNIIVKAQPPEEFTGIKVKSPAKNSVGTPAVLSSLAHANRYMNKSDALKTMFRVNQKGGFDCPGCAWPDPDDERSALGEYCENGVKAIAEEATKRRVTEEYFKKNSVQAISQLSDFKIGKLGRLTRPMLLGEGSQHYEPISWAQAFSLVAEELNALDSPDEALFYTSGRTSNEAAFLYQLFAREYGTNNLPDCSNMCHESSGQGLSQTLGIGKGSVTLHDLHQADVIMVMGQNPGTNHPRMLSALEKCKENGGKIITVNPLPEAGLMRFSNPQRPVKMLTGGTKLTDLFLQVRINGDVALLKAIMLCLLAEEDKKPGSVFDRAFIEDKTTGFEAFIEDLRLNNLEECVEQSGISLKQIKKAAKMMMKTQKIIICWAMGLTQHKNGVDNIKEVVNLLLLKGSVGKLGAGTCPVRGHSNVQGDRTMGIWEAPKTAFLDKLEEVFGFEPPRKHGYAVVDAINAMYQGKAKVFFAMGGNFLSASPDTEYTAKALQNCSLTVHVATKLNRSHLVHGKRALILPCLGRTEIDVQRSGKQFVSVENSMGIVHSSQGILPPASKELLSEPAIIVALAKATLGAKSKVNWDKMLENYDEIREHIEKVIPGFEQYNERVRQPAGFYLPNCAREGNFKTSVGKAVFTCIDIPEHKLDDEEFIMMTIRSHDQYNTTIYGLDDRYRGIYNERRVVLMNKKDMKTKKLKKGTVVDLVGTETINELNPTQRIAKKFLVVPYDIPSGCVATYFPEANVLVPIDSFAKGSKTPASKRVVIRIEKSRTD